MQRFQALLRRACLQLGAAGINVAAPAGSHAALTAHTGAAHMPHRILPNAAALLSTLAPAQSPLLAARGADNAAGLPPVAVASRSLHGTAAASSDDKAAAVRRLQAARLRRERLVEAPRERTSTGSSLEDAPGLTASDPHQLQQQEGAVVPVATTAVTPVESRASEAQVAAAIDHPALIVTRPIEWGTVIFGYEQANKYQVYDETGTIVALVAEDSGGIGKEIGRQLLRTRRSFTATVFSADGSQVLFRLRRPAYLISSTMFVEDGAGGAIGEIHQRWHMLKRNYDLYMGKSQFAAISGNFLAWEFELKDNTGGTLALVDRNFQGFAKELFTDAGKYVIHFGYTGDQLQLQQQQQQQQQQAAVGADQPAQLLPQQQQQEAAAAAAQPGQQSLQPGQQPGGQQQEAQVAPGTPAGPAAASAVGDGGVPVPPITPMAAARTDVAVIPVAGGNQLMVARPLGLSERMVALACALTIDYDFFSQHSHSGGGLVSPLLMPMPMPGGGGGGQEAGAGAGGGLPGAGAAGAAAGTVGEVPLDGDGGFGGEGAAPQNGGDAGGPVDGFDPGRSWDQQGGGEGGDGEMKWDLGGSGEGGGEEGGGGVVTGLLGTLWGLFGGD